MKGVPSWPTTSGSTPSHACILSHSKYHGFDASALLIIWIARASPSAWAILAFATPCAISSDCSASTWILLRSFSALNAFCSASTFDSIACAKSDENWKSVIETTSVAMLNSDRRAPISTSMSDLTSGLFVINSSAL